MRWTPPRTVTVPGRDRFTEAATSAAREIETVTAVQAKTSGERETAAAAAILSYGYLIVRVIPAPWYVPANLAAAGLAVLLARRSGAGWSASLPLSLGDNLKILKWPPN